MGFCGLFVVFIPAVCLFFVFVFSFSNCHDAMSGVLYSWKVSKEKCVTPTPPKKTKQKQKQKTKNRRKNNNNKTKTKKLNRGQSHERDSMVTKGDFFLKSFRNFVVCLYLN